MEAILLAAGLSSRAGDFKLAWTIGEKPLLVRQVELFSGVCHRIFVVGGHRIEEVCNLVECYSSVEIVENANFEQGMFSSVQTGVEQVSEDFFICPADYPSISSKTLGQLADGSGTIRIPLFQGRKGHPVFFEKQCKAGILEEPSNSTLRMFIEKRSFTALELDDPGILHDIDTKEDYARFIGSLESNSS